MIAASNGYFDLVKEFLDKSVDANLRDSNGWTAHDHAIRNGHNQVGSLLQLYCSENWPEVVELETAVKMFQGDLASNRNLYLDSDTREGLLRILSRPTYANLRKWIADSPIEGDELLWLGTSDVQIAVTQSGRNPWMMKGQRVPRNQ